MRNIPLLYTLIIIFKKTTYYALICIFYPFRSLTNNRKMDYSTIYWFSGFFETVIFLLFFVTLLSFAFGWVVTFLALKLNKMLGIELNEKYIKTFTSHKVSKTYKSLTINY